MITIEIMGVMLQNVSHLFYCPDADLNGFQTLYFAGVVIKIFSISPYLISLKYSVYESTDIHKFPVECTCTCFLPMKQERRICGSI